MAATSIFFVWHHRLEGVFGNFATRRHGFGQNPWCNLPRDTPFVLVRAALAFLPAVADNGVPVAVCFFLIIGRDLEREDGERVRRCRLVCGLPTHAADHIGPGLHVLSLRAICE